MHALELLCFISRCFEITNYLIDWTYHQNVYLDKFLTLLIPLALFFSLLPQAIFFQNKLVRGKARIHKVLLNCSIALICQHYAKLYSIS